jgi:uncharacterized protein YggE
MRGRRFLLGAAATAALIAGPVLAQDQVRDRLSVTVRGHATAPADEVAIELTVSASAEDASEAENRYREKLNGVLAALGKGDAKAAATDDGDSPRRTRRRKKPKDDSGDSTDTPKKKKASASDDGDDTPPKKTRKKKAADGDDDDAPPKKEKADKETKKSADDGDGSEAPKKSTKPKPADDDDEDAPKPKKKDAPKKDADDADKDAPDAKGDAPAPDSKKPVEPKKDESAEDEKFPFVIEVKEGGLTFGLKGGDPNQQRMRRMMNGNQPAAEEPQFRFSSEVSVIFKNVAKAEPRALRKRIAQVLDKVSNGGADMGLGTDGDGLPPFVRFSVTDVESLRHKANEDGMAAARKRGLSLAGLSDRALGKVLNVRDQTALPSNTRRPPYNPLQYGYNYAQVNPSTGEDWSTEVAVDVDLYVEFELVDKPGIGVTGETPKKP